MFLIGPAPDVPQHEEVKTEKAGEATAQRPLMELCSMVEVPYADCKRFVDWKKENQSD